MQKHQPRRHSDKVRRRLNEESKTSINRASTRISDPGSASLSGKRGKFSSADSNIFNHAQKTNGFFRIGWRLLSFLLIGASSFALLTAWRSPQYKVSTVQIKGLSRLSEDNVLSILDIYGQHIFALENNSIIQAIRQEFPELRDIEVVFSLPARVFLYVNERQPMIAWQTDNSLMWVDSEGYLIPARGDVEQMLTIQANALPAYRIIFDEEVANIDNVIRDKPQLKDVSGNRIFFSYPKQIDGNLLSAILQLNAWMPDEPVLLYQETRGIGWKDIRGWDVFIGSKLENINDKMLMYETIVRKLEEQGIHPSMVSVEFLHAPYYRLDE